MSGPNGTGYPHSSNGVSNTRDNEPEPVIELTERFKWARQRLGDMLNDIDSENKRAWPSREDIHSLILEQIEVQTHPELRVDVTPLYLFHLAPEITRARVASPCFPFKVDQIKAALYSLPDIWDETGGDRDWDFYTVDTAITMMRVQVGRADPL